MTSAEYEQKIDQRVEEIKDRDKKMKQLKAENSWLKKLRDSKAKSKMAKTPNFSLDKNNRGNSSKDTSAKKPGKPKGRKKNSAKRLRSFTK